MSRGDIMHKNEIDITYAKEKMKITCVERKYKVERDDISFVITARKELDEDTTDKLLYEDMELKTFLANYEIKDIEFQNIDIKTEPTIEHVISSTITEPIEPIIASDLGQCIINNNVKGSIVEIENIEPIKKSSSRKRYVKNVNMSHSTEERWALFDYLDLPKEFTCKNYVDALKNKGVLITNAVMPYDDMNHFEKIGKVTRIQKAKGCALMFRLEKIKIKKDPINEEILMSF